MVMNRTLGGWFGEAVREGETARMMNNPSMKMRPGHEGIGSGFLGTGIGDVAASDRRKLTLLLLRYRTSYRPVEFGVNARWKSLESTG